MTSGADPPEPMLQFPREHSSPSYHWSVAVIVVVLIIAVTAIIFAIIDYLKWSRSSIPISTPITSHHNTDNASDRVSSNLRRRHPSTVPDDYQTLWLLLRPEVKALVYEYMENGSLEKLLFSENREVDLEKLHVIAVQTAKGLAYLHEECEQRIIHYDIKPENVLLDRNLNAKVADFGLAKLCNRGSSQMLLTNFRGTAGYAAPELWKPYPVTHKCDVYSFGILLFDIVGRRRHCNDNVNESQDWLPKWTWNVFKKNDLEVLLLRCGIGERERGKAERMLLVALWCIQHAPEARPLMSNVVQMLEGHKEITPPPCPFEHLQSPQRNVTHISGTDEDTSTSASGTIISDSTGHEIELVVIK
ncbi:hypothetical protein M0R45_036500 [Rubus argutus]|uniref:Protein kinase domain-containing protein n=1 Tax=Rubus argutus TaxID=59490 RepID=A0AAW1VZ11_RUBAR